MSLAQFISVYTIHAKAHSVRAGCNGSHFSPFKTTYLYHTQEVVHCNFALTFQCIDYV